MEANAARPISWSHVIRGASAWAAVYGVIAAIGLAAFLGREFMDALSALGIPMPPTARELARIVTFGLVFVAVYGIATVWLYAVVRAHFGAGPRTASIVGLLVWLLSVVAPVSHLVVFGIVSGRFAAIDLPLECLLILLASLVGAHVYERASGTSGLRQSLGSIRPA